MGAFFGNEMVGDLHRRGWNAAEISSEFPSEKLCAGPWIGRSGGEGRGMVTEKWDVLEKSFVAGAVAVEWSGVLGHRYAVSRNLREMGDGVPWVGTHGYCCDSPTGFRRRLAGWGRCWRW